MAHAGKPVILARFGMMPLVGIVDPEGHDLAVVMRHVSFGGKDVLEIGCGEGRLTLQYAQLARSVTAIDPSPKAIASANRRLPNDLRGRLRFRVASGEFLPFQDASFDVVFYTWSLCCTDVPAMGKSLGEAWRALRPRGVVASVQPSLQQDFRYGMVPYLLERGSPAIQDEERTYAKSRLALRYSVLMARQFDFVAEEEYPCYTYYKMEADALRAFILGRRERYGALDREARRSIRDVVHSQAVKTKRGLRFNERAVLTVLRKRQRP